MKKLLQKFILQKKRKSKSFYLALLFPVFFFAFHSEKVSASHVAGGYLTYQWISGTTYLFTVTFYRDCAGIAAPAEMEIDFSSSCGAWSDFVYAPQIAGTGQQIGYPCPNSTTCDGGSNPGFQKYVYQAEATLNSNCSDFIMSFQAWPDDNPPQQLGRSNDITTLQPTCSGGTTQCDLYTQTTMTSVTPPINSLTFNNDPILFVCAGQNAIFNFGATDANGDSLTYQLVNAMSQSSEVVSQEVYESPLSGANPLFPVGSVSINSSTGDISVNTNVLQVGVIDVLVNQYSNGILVGSVVVDFQVIVQNCTNSYPTVSGINGTSVFTDSVCPGNTISFPVYSNDATAGDIVKMTWDNGIPAATFTSSGSPYPTGTFTWVTSTDDARTQPYTFTITVQDNNCPINGFQTHAYSIYVLGSAISVNPPTASICGGNSVSLTASGGGTYSWSPPAGLSATSGANVSAAPTTTTTYTVSSTNGNCNGTATAVITVQPLSLTTTPPDTTICSGNYVQLNAGGATNYVWSPSTSLTNANVADPVATPSVTTTYTVNASSGNCNATKTISVNVNESPTPPIITQSYDSLYCTADPDYTSYQWYFNNTIIPGATKSFYVASQSGNYNLAVRNSTGCAISVGINIVLGLQSLPSNQDAAFAIIPNPAGDEITIIGNFSAETGSRTITIYNVLGQEVSPMESGVLHRSVENSAINVHNLTPGIYFLKIADKSTDWVGKFVKE